MVEGNTKKTQFLTQFLIFHSIWGRNICFIRLKVNRAVVTMMAAGFAASGASLAASQAIEEVIVLSLIHI